MATKTINIWVYFVNNYLASYARRILYIPALKDDKMSFDVNLLLKLACDEDAPSIIRLEAKKKLRHYGYSEILDQRVAEHMIELKAKVRQECVEKDPLNGGDFFDQTIEMIHQELKNIRI